MRRLASICLAISVILSAPPAVKAQTSAAETLLKEGEALLDRGRVQAARGCWRAVVDEHPDSPAAPGALLHLAQTERDSEQALVWVAAIAERHADAPEAEPASALQGKILSELGEHERAVEILGNHLARYPQGEGAAEARDLLITSLIECGRARAALAEWDRAAEREPSRRDDAAAAMQRCEALLALGDWARAGQALRALAARFPNREQAPCAQLAAGLCLEALGKWEEAARLHAELTRQWPDVPEARLAERRVAALRDLQAALAAIDQSEPR